MNNGYAYECNCYNVKLSNKGIKPPKKVRIGVTNKEINEYGWDAMDNVIEDALKRKFGCGIEYFEYYPIDEYNDKD